MNVVRVFLFQHVCLSPVSFRACIYCIVSMGDSMVIFLPAPRACQYTWVGISTEELLLLIPLWRLIKSIMPPMGGHWVQRILGGVADGLELSKRPLCELKNCTGASLRSALFLACINWITQVKSEWDFCRTVHWDIERTTAVPSVMQQHKMIFFFFHRSSLFG